METREAAHRWAQTWERAWRGHDAELLRAVYAEGCVFRSDPFRAARDPVEYAAWAFGDEPSAEPRFGEPLVDRDRASVPWWTKVRNEDGSEQTLAGCSLLRFDEDGLVVYEHDYWAVADGHADPFPGWS